MAGIVQQDNELVCVGNIVKKCAFASYAAK